MLRRGSVALTSILKGKEMETVKKFKCTYKGGQNTALDDDVISALATLGFEFYASGYNVKTNTRDLCFERKE